MQDWMRFEDQNSLGWANFDKNCYEFRTLEPKIADLPITTTWIQLLGQVLEQLYFASNDAKKQLCPMK